MCTSYVHTPVYIVDICSKEVSKCTVTFELHFFVKIANSNVITHIARIPLVSVFWWSNVVGGIRGKQIQDYKSFLHITVNLPIPTHRGLDVCVMAENY